MLDIALNEAFNILSDVSLLSCLSHLQENRWDVFFFLSCGPV